MAEETKKTYTDIEKADAFYDAVMKYKEKIEKTESGLATFEKSGKYKEYDAQEAKAMEALEGLGTLSDVQKDMVASNKEVSLEHDAREKLLAQKEKYLESVSALEGQIKIAISKYIADTEKEQKKLEKDKAKYTAYVEEEKAKCEALKAELDAMAKDDVTYEDKKAEVEALVSRIENMDKKLASFDQSLAKVTEGLNKNKEKYKDYIDLAKEDLTVPKAPVEEKDDVEKTDEEIPKTEAEKDVEEKEEIIGKAEDLEEVEDVEVESEETPEIKSESVTNRNKTRIITPSEAAYVAEPSEITSQGENELPKEQESKESDKQAFKRIYKLIKKKETLSIEDTDRMIALMGNRKNFARFRISTDRFLFFKSKGEKIFTGLGVQLAKQIRGTVKDERLTKKLRTKDIRQWDRILELGNNNPNNNIVETLDEATKSASDEELESIKAVRERYEQFTNSAKVLCSVKVKRGELKLLPAKVEEQASELVDNTSDVEITDRPKGLDELSSMVKSEEEIAEKDVATSTETTKKAVEKTTEEKII